MATKPRNARDTSPQPAGPANKGLKVAALQENGRHRAGRFWPQEATTVPLAKLTEEDVEAIKADPKLFSQEVDIEPPAEA